MMQPESPNLAYKCSTMSLETRLFWGQKVKVTSDKNSASVGLRTLVSAGF